jgi:hypothetical protein
MKKARGYAIIHDPTVRGGVIELETTTCQHCGYVMDKPPLCRITDTIIGRDNKPHILGAWCWKCDSPVCLNCARSNRPCKPIEAWCEEIEQGHKPTLDELHNKISVQRHYDHLLGYER